MTKEFQEFPLSLRTHLSLDGQWCFSLTKILDPNDCSQITVPSPWQADARFRDHIGEAWYLRDFDVPAEWLAPGGVRPLMETSGRRPVSCLVSAAVGIGAAEPGFGLAQVSTSAPERRWSAYEQRRKGARC